MVFPEGSGLPSMQRNGSIGLLVNQPGFLTILSQTTVQGNQYPSMPTVRIHWPNQLRSTNLISVSKLKSNKFIYYLTSQSILNPITL